jgi:CRISPR-associated exonuclease Cas4
MSSGVKAVRQSEKILEKARNKIKEGVDNYRAASDAPPKVDVYDVIEQVFSLINPTNGDESKISIDEVSGCLRRAYLDRKDPQEATHKQMMATIIEKGALSILEKPATGEIDAGSGVKLVGRADRVEDEVVMVFRSVAELPEMPFAEHFMQLNAYLHMFNKQEGVIIYFDTEGNELEFVVPRSEKLLNETTRRARILNTLLKNNIAPTLEPSNRCINCPHNEKCYYPSEDKQKWGFWARGKWRELKAKPIL